jgi:radical SAM protein with 4Fe4S-binding SPASM domain
MIDDQVMHIGRGIVEHMQKIGYSNAEIHFVGGEPTMLGLAFFQKNIPLFKDMVKNAGFNAEVMMISNLLHDDILEISQLFDRVTTSYEIDTRFVSTKGVYKPALEAKWVKNVKKLQENGIDLGITTAITKPVINYGAEKLLNYFYDKGIKQIHFGFFIPEGDGLVNMNSIMPAFHETSQFLIDSANWYLERREKDPDLWVNPFESMLSAIHSDEPLDDIVCPMISGSMDINWDGNAATCLEAGGAKNPEWSGNIFTSSIAKVASTEHFLKKVLEAQKPQKICRTCDEYRVCKSGCSVLFKFFDPVLDEECPGFKRFIQFVREKNEGGLIPRYTKYLGKSC